MEKLTEEEQIALQEAALEQIKAVFEDSKATINEHDYVFTKMLFGERRAVFAYLTSIKSRVEEGDMSFLETPKFKQIETLIFKHIIYDGMTLNKVNVFEKDDEFIADYMMLITTALQVISYPFSKGGTGK